MELEYSEHEMRVLIAIVDRGSYDEDRQCITLPRLRDSIPCSLRDAGINFESSGDKLFINDELIDEEFMGSCDQLPIGIWDKSFEIQTAFLTMLFGKQKTFTAKNKNLAKQIERLAMAVNRQIKILP